MSDPRLSYYHLRYHLWVGVYRDSSGSSSTATEQKAHKRDQTGPDGTLLKHGMPRYESEDRRFESCRARSSNSCICRSFSCSSAFSAASSSGFDGSVNGVGSLAGPSEAAKRS